MVTTCLDRRPFLVLLETYIPDSPVHLRICCPVFSLFFRSVPVFVSVRKKVDRFSASSRCVVYVEVDIRVGPLSLSRVCTLPRFLPPHRGTPQSAVLPDFLVVSIQERDRETIGTAFCFCFFFRLFLSFSLQNRHRYPFCLPPSSLRPVLPVVCFLRPLFTLLPCLLIQLTSSISRRSRVRRKTTPPRRRIPVMR